MVNVNKAKQQEELNKALENMAPLVIDGEDGKFELNTENFTNAELNAKKEAEKAKKEAELEENKKIELAKTALTRSTENEETIHTKEESVGGMHGGSWHDDYDNYN